MVVDPDGPIVEGSSVTLVCRSRANPAVTNYTWYKDEVERETGSSLVINGVDASHSGDYRCAAKNELGEDVSSAIQLDIQCKFILHSEDIDLRCKHTTNLYVSSVSIY